MINRQRLRRILRARLPLLLVTAGVVGLFKLAAVDPECRREPVLEAELETARKKLDQERKEWEESEALEKRFREYVAVTDPFLRRLPRELEYGRVLRELATVVPAFSKQPFVLSFEEAARSLALPVRRFSFQIPIAESGRDLAEALSKTESLGRAFVIRWLRLEIESEPGAFERPLPGASGTLPVVLTRSTRVKGSLGGEMLLRVDPPAEAVP